MDEKQIAAVLKKEKFVEPAPAPARETYTRMSRKYLSIETLNRYRIDYEFDMVGHPLNQTIRKELMKSQDPEYVLIKRWVPGSCHSPFPHSNPLLFRFLKPVFIAKLCIQDNRVLTLLLEHEQDLLWNHTREIRELRQPTTILAIEGKKKHHEPEFEFVRKKKHHERKPSPSALLTYLAGGRR
jgi:hypothetical protein